MINAATPLIQHTTRDTKTMCTNVIKANGIEFACRQCDQCIGLKISDWVSRCMAEKAVARHTTLLTLTYRNNHEGEKPISAKHFVYADVNRFLKTLRSAYKYQYDEVGEIRFVCAGERGEKLDRVHWHLVLFTDKPIEGLGKLKGEKSSWQFDKSYKNRNEWSLWPHGHVNVAEPDEAGMMYVLKYALKEQFNVVKSKGSNRYTKSENHNAGMFRMSKRPPIGQRFLQTKLDQLAYNNWVPVDFNIQIPATKGYWYLNGALAEWYACQIYTLNEQIKKQTGRNAPQWSGLIHRVGSRQKIMEILEHGQKIEKKEDFGYNPKYSTFRDIRKRCGGKTPCSDCRGAFTPDEAKAYNEWFDVNKPKNWAKCPTEHRYRHGYEPNHFCKNRNEKNTRNAFTEKALG